MNITIDLNWVLYIAGAIVTIAGAYTILQKSVYKKVSKLLEEMIENYFETIDNKHDDSIKELSDKLNEFMLKSENSDKNIKNCLLASTRERINQLHKHYMDQGEISSHSLYVIEDLYASYKSLGGNHGTDDQMREIRKLKIV